MQDPSQALRAADEVLAAQTELLLEQYDHLCTANARLKAQAAELQLLYTQARLHGENLERLVQERTCELERANQAKSAFLSAMSHELRTPLNAIIGYGELAREDLQGLGHQEVAADLTKIVGAGRELLRLVNDVLDITAIEAGDITMQAEPVQVEVLVRDLVAATAARGAVNHNILTVTIAPDVGEIVTDPGRLCQVLVKVLDNATKFTQDGKIDVHVRCEAHGQARCLAIEVRDTGIGIAPERMGEVFLDFVQLDSRATRRFGGTGLGLAICRRLCQLLGGDVAVQSTLGVGSTFTVRLPLTTGQTAGSAGTPLLGAPPQADERQAA